MIKRILFSAFFSILTNFSFSQLLSGELLDSGRKMLSPYSFEIKDKYNGYQLFELAVNPEGKVSGVRDIHEKGVIVSTPAKMLASSELYELKFESASHFPKFHHVKVKVNFVKSTN